MRFRLKDISPLGYAEYQLRKKKNEALKKLSSYQIDQLFAPNVVALARSVANQHETNYLTDESVDCLYRGLGNGVTFLQVADGLEVRHAYYLDLQSGQAIDVLELAPDVRVLAGDRWYFSPSGEFVSFPARLDNQSHDSPELLSAQVVLAPSHELMHSLREKANYLVNVIADRHEERQSSVGSRSRGSDEERMAMDLSLHFVRRAKALGVDLMRGRNVAELIKLLNDGLSNHGYR